MSDLIVITYDREQTGRDALDELHYNPDST